MPDGEIGLWGGSRNSIRDGEKRLGPPEPTIPDGIFKIGPDRARFGVLIFVFFEDAKVDFERWARHFLQLSKKLAKTLGFLRCTFRPQSGFPHP